MMQRNSGQMNRREALRRLAFMTGGTLSASTVAGILSGCRAEKPGAEGWMPQTLSNEQFELVGDIAEHIIPTTDTPGAHAAEVPAFIDKMLTQWMTEAEKEHFLSGLDQVNEVAQASYGSAFLDLPEPERIEVLRQLEARAEATEDDVVTVELERAWPSDAFATTQDLTEQDLGPSQPDTIAVRLRPFFAHVKELTIVGYYTSEVGAAKELQYKHVPGRYDGCAPLDEIGRTWAASWA